MTWDVSTHTVRQEERNKYILLPFCSVQPLDGLDNIHSHWGKSSILLRSLTQRTHSEIMLDLAMASRINTWNQLSQSVEVFFTAVVIRFLLNICRVWTYISPFKLPSLVCSVYMRVCMCAYIIAMLSDFTFSFLFFLFPSTSVDVVFKERMVALLILSLCLSFSFFLNFPYWN